MTGVDWSGGDATEARLPGAILTGATMMNMYAPKADFRRVDFADAVLTGGTFFETTFADANFTRAKLGDSDFRQSRLEGATFVDADLGASHFEQAWTQGADFTGSIREQAIGLRIPK